jgi:hypothetical protein
VYSNYTFSNLSGISQPKIITDHLVEVTSSDTMKGSDEWSRYFPEKVFCEWQEKTFNEPTKMYLYAAVSAQQLAAIFNLLYEKEGIDYHFVVDGGCDGVFRGDEYDLGTPAIDAVSVIAASLSNKLCDKRYVMTAFGTEGVGRSVSHAEVLRRVSELMESGLAVSSITNNREAAKLFQQAFEYMTANMPIKFQSTIVSSICSSLRGQFGDRAVNAKTDISPVWVSPLTSLIWYLDIEAVAKSKLYYEEVVQEQTPIAVHSAIERFVKSRPPHGEKESIPI